MDEQKGHRLGNNSYYSICCLFSCQSPRPYRSDRSQIIHAIVHHRLDCMVVGHGTGYGSDSHVPTAGRGSQREIVCKHHSSGQYRDLRCRQASSIHRWNLCNICHNIVMVSPLAIRSTGRYRHNTYLPECQRGRQTPDREIW